MRNLNNLSGETILIPTVFGENSCTKKPQLEFEDVYEADRVPGELLIETLWRKEANASFLEAGFRPLRLRV